MDLRAPAPSPPALHFDGEIFGTADGAEACRRALQRGGPRAVAELDGFFVAACPAPEGGALHLVTDHIGSRPLYWAREAERVVFASSATEVLARLPVLPPADERGVAHHVLMGFPLQESTLWRGVQRVTPATVLTLDRSGARAERTWTMRYVRDASTPRSLSAAVDLLKTTFLASFTRMNPEEGPFLLPLSGGMDSRLIAAALAATGKRANTVTIGGEGSLDLVLAAEVARRLGFPHRSVVMQPADVPGWLVDGARATDGMSYALDTHILFLLRNVADDGSIALDGTSSIDGFYSLVDVWIERCFGPRIPPMRQARNVFTGPIFDLAGEITQPELIAPARREAWRAHLHEGIATLLASVPAEERKSYDRIDWMEMCQRIPRYTLNGTVLLRTRHEVRHPFFAREFLEVVGRVPYAMRAKEKPALGRVCAAIAPQLADLVYERTGVRGDAGTLRILLAHARRSAAKALHRLVPAVPAPRKTVAIDYARWLASDPALQAFVRSTLLDERALARGFFAPDALRAWVEGILAGSRSELALLSRLLSLEIGLRSAEECHSAGAAGRAAVGRG